MGVAALAMCTRSVQRRRLLEARARTATSISECNAYGDVLGLIADDVIIILYWDTLLVHKNNKG